MQKINRLVTWPVVLLFLACSSAMASTDIPSPDVDAAAWAKLLYEAFISKAWTALVGLVLIAAVYPLRRWGGMVVPWFKTSFGGLVLSFAVSLAGTMGAAMAAHVPMSLSLVAAALTTAATAAGFWEWIKDHVPGMQVAAAKAVA